MRISPVQAVRFLLLRGEEASEVEVVTRTEQGAEVHPLLPRHCSNQRRCVGYRHNCLGGRGR